MHFTVERSVHDDAIDKIHAQYFYRLNLNSLEHRSSVF